MTPNDTRKFVQRCKELRNAAAAVDVFQRSAPKGDMETVTIHIHTNDDQNCLTRFDVPLGAINQFCQTNLIAVDLAEKLVSAVAAVEGFGGDGRINNGGYRDGGLA